MASPLTLALLALPYALAISFLGQCLGAAFVRREAAVLVLIGAAPAATDRPISDSDDSDAGASCAVNCAVCPATTTTVSIVVVS